MQALTAIGLALVTLVGIALAVWPRFSEGAAEYFRDSEYRSTSGTWTSWAATSEQFRFIGAAIAVAAVIGLLIVLQVGR